uniref:Nicotinamide-nucleotide adenylyltransferase n=1 Tax=Anthurium amnicola TaxID=1678845 RepID=A0A1D1XFQ8_9ARAE
MDAPLPTTKLSLPPPPSPPPGTQDGTVGASGSASYRDQVYVVLVSTGSFNPPTYMHLRMFELARDALNSEGYFVIGGYMSPVNDSYKKKGLLSAEHRVHMCELACRSSSFVMVDSWEARQSSYQRTLTIISRIQSYLCESGLITKGSLKVMLLCGSDLLESFGTPGVWIRDHVKTICRDFGVVCVRREGRDVEKLISSDEVLFENKNNIFAVDELVPNQISSTKVRECIRRGLSIKYLIADEVIEYIGQQHLYLNDDKS